MIRVPHTTAIQKDMYSDTASGWAGWALAHPEFVSSVNPIITRGADFAHRITACPPGCENLAASLKEDWNLFAGMQNWTAVVSAESLDQNLQLSYSSAWS